LAKEARLGAELAVEVRGIVKRFGADVVALDGLDLSIATGETYGLLGPNGAGKTTTLRMLLGLVRPTSGLIRVLGQAPGAPAALRQTGAMGETAFYPFLSGRDNLRAAARRSGVTDARVDVVLAETGMTARGGDPVGTYSYGMKQRLGVADPRLLILDEPSNGLDPAGQLDMRRLIQDLGGSRTIVLSSHDMDEVEQLCGRAGIISGGRLLTEDTPEHLRGAARLLVRAEPADRAAALAATLAGVERAELSGGSLALALPEVTPARAAAINRELVGAGLEVSEVMTDRRPLREVFLELTGRRTGGSDSVRLRAGGGKATAGQADGGRSGGRTDRQPVRRRPASGELAVLAALRAGLLLVPSGRCADPRLGLHGHRPGLGHGTAQRDQGTRGGPAVGGADPAQPGSAQHSAARHATAALRNLARR
jgi:ABC-2 type transport system ATP-binding protein